MKAFGRADLVRHALIPAALLFAIPAMEAHAACVPTFKWSRTLAASMINGVAVDGNGDVGAVGNLPSGHLCVAKVKSDGTVAWTTTDFGTPGVADAYVFGIAPDGFGNWLVHSWGTDPGPGANYGLLTKYDSAGTVVWSQAFAGPSGEGSFFWGMSVDAGGGSIVCGELWPDPSDYGSAFLCRYDPAGNLLWSRTYSFSGVVSGDEFSRVAYAPMGEIVVLGVSSIWEPYLIRLDSVGEPLSVRKITGCGSMDWMAVSRAGNIALAGWLRDGCVNAYDSAGNVLWTDTTVGGPVAYYGPNDSLLLGGAIIDPAESSPPASYEGPLGLRKYTGTGSLEWSTSYTYPPRPQVNGGDAAWSVAAGPGGFIAVGGCGNCSSGGSGASAVALILAFDEVCQQPDYPRIVPGCTPVVFPNPFSPTKSVEKILKFLGLSPGCTLRIHTLSGTLLWKGTASASGLVAWDGRTLEGMRVQPGIYRWAVEGGYCRSNGRFLVIR